MGLAGHVPVPSVCHSSPSRRASLKVQVHLKPLLASHFHILLAKENHMPEPMVRRLSRPPAHSGRALQGYVVRSMDIENNEELDQIIAIYPKMQMEAENLL